MILPGGGHTVPNWRVNICMCLCLKGHKDRVRFSNKSKILVPWVHRLDLYITNKVIIIMVLI